MTVAIVGLAGVVLSVLATFVTSRRTASSSELTTVMTESREMRVELRFEAAALRVEAEELRARLARVESLCDRMAARLAEEGIVVT